MRSDGVMSKVENKDRSGIRVPSRQLVMPLALEEGRVPGLSRALLVVSALFVLACVLWASITQIRELTVASGQVKPSGSVRIVQHLEGGLVAEILAEEGEVVEQGRVLLRLQPVAAESDFAQSRVRAASLGLQKERLSALIDDRTPDWSPWKEGYPHLIQDQIETMDALRQQRENERQTLATRIELREAEAASLSRQVDNVLKQVAIQKEQLDIRRNLMAEGLTSRATYLDFKRQYEKVQGEQLALQGQLRTAQKSLNEARIQLLELDSDYRKKLTEERGKVAAELAETMQMLAKLEDRVARLEVRAPIKGVVQELVPGSIGEVVAAGGVVAQIVPMENELIAEVQILPQDIGHVKIGDPAEVKITTYDPARFGGIEGRVRQISASTFQTDKGEPYYKAVIGLSKTYVGDNGNAHHVLPGMVVSAEIITGAKSLTRYMLKPVFNALDKAFSER